MRPKRILILGGTGLAREAAAALLGRGHHVMSSLAGVTSQPHLPEGDVRIGGFGGFEGLTKYLQSETFDLVVDATHAFAAQISRHAAAAARSTDTELIRLQSLAWTALPPDHWTDVADIDAAIASLGLGQKIAVTVGRKDVAKFFARVDLSGVARMIEPPETVVPPQWHVVLERPPFMFESETAFLRAHGAAVLVCKNAGGMRPAKLDAAAALKLPVVMIARPEKPVVNVVGSVEELLGSLAQAR